MRRTALRAAVALAALTGLTACASTVTFTEVAGEDGPTIVLDVTNASALRRAIEYGIVTDGDRSQGGTSVPECTRIATRMGPAMPGTFEVLVDRELRAEQVLGSALMEAEVLIVTIAIPGEGEPTVGALRTADELPSETIVEIPGCAG